MKKNVMMFSLMLIVCFSLVSAIAVVEAKTMIAGKIYNSEWETVSGADVTVTCNGNVQTNVSSGVGTYAVIYYEADCEDGDSLEVYASHLSEGVGSNNGVINENLVQDWDVGIVNVQLVPEFGVVVGILTILSAVGVFFFVRRD